ncbi:MAG: class I SAM-dependent methyltransferase [Proteobacteria bacterium]|nr:class I SAM-dependent methyltransferase [Pseudomonadota bacterium]
MNAGFSSAAYWEARYGGGGTSGSGSRGRLLACKAALVNGLIAENGIGSVLDLGCGDGELAALLEAPAYVGLDVSPTTVARCAARFAGRTHMRFLTADRAAEAPPADLALSLDVIFHLVEDAAFAAHLALLFARARRYVLIYSSNAEQGWPSLHVRHRRFTEAVAATQPGWRLLAHLPNPYPFDPARPDETSFADFFLYGRTGAADDGCVVRVPAA